MDNAQEKIAKLEQEVCCLTEENCNLKKRLEQMQGLKLMTLDESIKHFQESANNLDHSDSQVSRGNLLNVAIG